MRFILSLYCIALCSCVKGQVYTNVSESQGLTFLVNSVSNNNFGNGVSYYDFDEDGWDDLTFAMIDDSLEFYRNNQGVLERLASVVYGDGIVKHVLWVDYDNDGDLDLFITTYLGPYKLYQNDGEFNFTDVSVQAGLIQANEKHYGASFGDYNKDGFLDLYVCTYEFEGDISMYNKLNHLYRNNGNGTFTDVSVEAGVTDGITFSFQSIWMDYNKDGWQDILVINDRLNANSLYRNNTDGTFTNVAESAGVAWPGQDPMSATVGDFDNDGDLDVFHSNTGSVGKHFHLWVNNDNGTFTESAAQNGLEVYSWTWGSLWVDVDNDTRQDLYVTSSRPNNEIESNFFYYNQSPFGFVNGLSSFEGDHVTRSFCASRGDLNNDGFYEIAVQNQNPTPPYLWQNSGGESNFIKITLEGTVSNRMAIGSWIKVYADGNQYTQYTLCGENYLGQNSQHHIFGLADYELVDSVEIEYISGHIDKYYNLAVNESYQFTEGDTYVANITTSGNTSFCQGDSVILYSNQQNSIVWSTGSLDTSITVFESGDYWYVSQNEFGITAVSDTTSVLLYANPVVSIIENDPLCQGDANGSIVVMDDSGELPISVFWENGMLGDSIFNLTAGNYPFVYNDLNGCSTEGLAQLQEPFELSVQVFTNPDFGLSDGSIILIVNGGTPPYDIYLNGELAGTNNENLSFGVYNILVEDNNGCVYESTIVIDNLTRILINGTEDFIIYPNPSNGNVSIQSTNQIVLLQVFDSQGRIVHEVNSPFFKLDMVLNNLSDGYYILKYQSANKQGFKKLFIEN